MKTLQEIEELLAEKIEQKEMEINLCQIEINNENKLISDLSGKLKKEDNLDTFNDLKEKIADAKNLKEFYLNKLEKLKNIDCISSERKELTQDILIQHQEINNQQFKRAAELMKELEKLSNESLDLMARCEKISEDFNINIPRTDYVFGFFGQIKNTAMFNTITKK